MPEGKTPLPLCTECHAENVKPVLVSRSNKVVERLARKKEKEDAKALKKAAAAAANAKPKAQKGAKANKGKGKGNRASGWW